VRASNTTPVLVLRFEGHTPEALERIRAQFLAAVRSVKPDAQVGGAAH
jgi:phosphomannomutase